MDTAAHFFGRAFLLLQQRFRDASSTEALQECFQQFQETFECPWTDQGHRPLRFRYFWNRDLEKIAKNRDKLRKIAKHTGARHDWVAHQEENKRLKRESRRQKRARARGNFLNLAYKDPAKANSILATALKNTRQGTTNLKDAARALNAQDFTKLLSQKLKGWPPVPSEPFEVGPRVKRAIGTALRLMKSNRSAGMDNIFSEGLQLVCKEATDLICEIWAACGRLNCTPRELREAEVIPLHKKRETSDPENYRPISLISHVRKIIDKAIDILIREEYNFHRFQVGFRSTMGTETAILRASRAIDEDYHYLACLDLKSAYDSVPRRKLMRRLQRLLSKNVCAMVTHTLQPTKIVTRGDNTQLQGQLELGVQQGSPTSPSLFNIYIDGLANDIERLAGFDTSNAAILYADDVLLLAKTPWELQRLLDIATRWAGINDMTWSTGKSSVMVPSGCNYRFSLAHEALQREEEIEYLGSPCPYKVSLRQSNYNECRQRKQNAPRSIGSSAELVNSLL